MLNLTFFSWIHTNPSSLTLTQTLQAFDTYLSVLYFLHKCLCVCGAAYKSIKRRGKNIRNGCYSDIMRIRPCINWDLLLFGVCVCVCVCNYSMHGAKLIAFVDEMILSLLFFYLFFSLCFFYLFINFFFVYLFICIIHREGCIVDISSFDVNFVRETWSIS